jgi:hypothetical protein
MTTATYVDTGKVTGRRTLRFNSVEDLFRDAQMLLAAEKAGTLKRLGNWTLGQAFGHIAAWAEFPLNGYPPDLQPPWFVKLIVGRFKNKYLAGLPAGKRIPGIKEGTKATEVMTSDAGLDRMQRAYQRLQAQAPTLPNPLFGPLTHAEWLALNLRHAELHLSFFVPG